MIDNGNIDLALRTARRMLHSMPASIDRDDVEQTALEAAVRCCSTYDPDRGPLEPYMRRAVANALKKLAAAERSFLRRPPYCAGQPHTVCDGERGGEWDLSDLGEQADGIERGSLLPHLRRSIAALPSTERELVLAMYGIDQEPVAHDRVIGATRQAAEQRRDKALLLMRRHMDPVIPRRRASGDQYVPPRRLSVRLDRAQWEQSLIPPTDGPGKGRMP